MPRHKQPSEIQRIRDIWTASLDSRTEVYDHERAFMPVLFDIASKADRILEVGAGTGRALKLLAAARVRARLYGLDVNPLPAETPAVGVIGDARRMPFQSGSFDLVFSLGVVEHWPDTGTAIREHARVVARGGHVLVTTPHLSVYTPVRLASYAMRREFTMGSFEQVRGRNLTVGGMVGLFNAAGLRVLDSGLSGIYSRTAARLLGRAARLMPQSAYLWVLGCRS